MVATGLNKGKLGLPNEADFEGRGVSHCASCDGPLFAGLPVVVAGAAGWAGMEARELAGVAGVLSYGRNLGPAGEQFIQQTPWANPELYAKWSPAAHAAKGTIQSHALDNPLVKQAQELFRAEVRSILDLRGKP